ncbi:unnamed protein product [Mytilus coruscus]|uniref:Uncharacterized protein n=1 Tax=Mytilus coruscus TaxID=42192 RepID=A0A6J8AGZ2_MYTCO|nr:unnamed protein product [Mytilus coruscus]
MMLQLTIVFCIIFGCTYANSPADHYISITASIMGKSDNDIRNDLDSCAEMDYPNLDDISTENGMVKCILDVVNDLCPEGTCTPATRVSLIYIGWYKVEERKECVDLDEDAAYDPSCHIRIKVKYASASMDHFDVLFWFLYDPEVTEMKGCNEERSLQSPVSQRKKKNFRAREGPPPPPPPPKNIPLHKKGAVDVEKVNEAIMKSRDAGMFSYLKRKLRRFNSN